MIKSYLHSRNYIAKIGDRKSTSSLKSAAKSTGPSRPRLRSAFLGRCLQELKVDDKENAVVCNEAEMDLCDDLDVDDTAESLCSMEDFNSYLPRKLSFDIKTSLDSSARSDHSMDVSPVWVQAAPGLKPHLELDFDHIRESVLTKLEAPVEPEISSPASICRALWVQAPDNERPHLELNFYLPDLSVSQRRAL